MSDDATSVRLKVKGFYGFQRRLEIDVVMREMIGSRKNGHGLALPHCREPAWRKDQQSISDFTRDANFPAAIGLILIADKPVVKDVPYYIASLRP